ncbi:unnamed protein product [Anisakis simplex]|uniref:ASMase_C domain-containing protein n=1 Tax=Anisakis simplex TaxID=6269 RepID=A0A0M3J2C3_ANISI|nr:unnamed protein product [Anisakis simplex]
MNTFLKGGYYKYVLGDKVVVLALNTNLYYRFNRAIPNFTNPDDPADQFQFMIDTLKDARTKQLSVHVIAHIAPGDTIKSMIFGHHHTDTFHIVKDPKSGRAVQVYLMAPAITPWFNPFEGAGSNNPAFRIYDYDEGNQRLIDAKTYYVNLTKLNRSPHNQTKWELEYSMAKTYQIDGITPENMYSVLKKLKTGGDAFKSYIEYNSVRWNVSIPEGEFLKAQLCSIEFPDFTGYDQCMGSSGPSSKSPGSLSTSTKSGPSSKSPGSVPASTKSVYLLIALCSLIKFSFDKNM